MPNFVISIWIQIWIWVWSVGYMECGNTPHSEISIQIQTWIWIWSMDIHGVWRDFTFHNVHMDMDMAPCSHIITVT